MIETVSKPINGTIYGFRVLMHNLIEPSESWVYQQGICAACEVEVVSMNDVRAYMYFVRYEDAFSYVMIFG